MKISKGKNVSMIGFATAILWVVVCLGFNHSALAQADARSTYQSSHAKITGLYLENQKKTSATYFTHLHRMEKQAQAFGDLDGVVWAAEEAERYRNEQQLDLEDIDAAKQKLALLQHAMMKELQKIEQQRDRELAVLYEQYLKHLAKLENDFVRQDKLP